MGSTNKGGTSNVLKKFAKEPCVMYLMCADVLCEIQDLISVRIKQSLFTLKTEKIWIHLLIFPLIFSVSEASY